MRSGPANPIKLHQAMTPNGVILDRKVTSDVSLASKSWHSTRAHDFTVAPLPNHDALLGMPFLATENILIDPANKDIILPKPPCDPTSTNDPVPVDDTIPTDDPISSGCI